MAPVITSTPPPSGSYLQSYDFTITATGLPAPVFQLESGALPTGLQLDPLLGVISGTPDSVTTSPASGVITVSNGVGSAVPQAFAIDIAPVLPAAPQISAVLPADGRVEVHFDPPPHSGGIALLGYSAGCGTQTSMGMASPLLVAGLDNFVPVNCRVRARNALGDGPESASSQSVIPLPDRMFGNGFE